jgi:IclR family pca regulon transcriptional regulator
LNASGTDPVPPAPVHEDSSSPSRTLEKGLQVLSLFDIGHPEWTLKDIRETARLPKATGFRLVKTLENLKYLAQDPKTGTYRLGSAMMKAAYLTHTHSALVGVAGPFIQTLADATTETVDLSVPTDQGAMIVHTLYTSRPFRPYNPPGMTMTGLTNVHCKIFVAFGPGALWAKAIAGSLPRTALSVTDPDRLAAVLAEVRLQGVAFGLEEHKLGMCAVGAPVFDPSGDVRAVLAVVMPVERFGDAERRSYAAAVIESAAGLSRELGYTDQLPGRQQPSQTSTAEQKPSRHAACSTPPPTTRALSDTA